MKSKNSFITIDLNIKIATILLLVFVASIIYKYLIF
jgi:hypothetical protein